MLKTILTVPLVFSIFHLSVVIAEASPPTCGYSSCPKSKDGYLNVHLVPHSHDDMGWLKTVDEYYYGANNSIQNAGVQYILDSVVDELLKDSNRRFIYVEIGFFWRWWKNQNSQKQEQVKMLIESGRLEFINGGWCMNDEATTHYNEIIDQMSLGLRFLNETFGECGLPRVAWQIDPFGHSREQASLFAQMGFDGLFFGRLDYQDKIRRETTKNMEMIWSGSPKNLGKNAWLFTSVLKHGYNPPDGFCWDTLCNDNPIMDDPNLLNYNVEDEVKRFKEAVRDWASAYSTNHILMTMGSDFQFMSARMWYKNLDKMIKYVNERVDSKEQLPINLLYSTPSCYLQEVNKAGLGLELKRDDFFPYASSAHSFWTGYFTSRPALKYFIHKTNNFLQTCKNFAYADDSSENIKKVFKLSEPMAVAQHHDAIAGTAKQHVTDDYALRLNIGIEACEGVIGDFMKTITHNKNEILFCHQLNISACTPTETLRNFEIHIYNPLGREIQNTYIRIPVPSASSWEVRGSNGELIPTQLVPIPQPVLNIPGRKSNAFYEVIVPIQDLLPLALTTISFERKDENDILRVLPDVNFNDPIHSQQNEDISFINENGIRFSINSKTGLISQISTVNPITGVATTIDLTQNFYYYTGMTRDMREFDQQASGAYIFRPKEKVPKVVSATASYTIHTGEFVTEVHQKFNEWLSQVIRLYKNSTSIEFEYLVGPIPPGVEIVTKYTSSLDTGKVFYTDSNGREILKRQRDFRPTWPYRVYEPISGNYYPVNSRMIITEGPELIPTREKTLILLNDRAQGGTSMKSGEMEIMLHRRLLVDDGFGVGEALNEMAFGEGLVVRGKHWLVLAGEGTGVPVSIHRSMAQEIYKSPQLIFQSISQQNETNYITTQDKVMQLFNSNGRNHFFLPPNIHLLTLEKINVHQGLLRLEHFYETHEDITLSKKSFVEIEDLVTVFGFSRMEETMLGGNVLKYEFHRMNWLPKSSERLTSSERNTELTEYKTGDRFVEFQPMEIKTFVLYYN